MMKAENLYTLLKNRKNYQINDMSKNYLDVTIKSNIKKTEEQVIIFFKYLKNKIIFMYVERKFQEKHIFITPKLKREFKSLIKELKEETKNFN